MFRMRPLPLIRALCLGASATACTVNHWSKIAGCYRFDEPLFEWSVYDMASGGSHVEKSDVLQLLATPDPRLIERPRPTHPALGLQIPTLTDTAAAHRYALLSFWGVVAPDSIGIIWSDGHDGWYMQLRSEAGGLYGSATEITDVGGFPTRHLEHLRALRIRCPR
jgi:hypothetical protein